MGKNILFVALPEKKKKLVSGYEQKKKIAQGEKNP